VDPNGEIVAQLPLFEEAVMDVEVDINYLQDPGDETTAAK
jgi:apolipoprotein N-acyltransferase